MKSGLILAFFAAPMCSMASFEVVLVGDAGNAGFRPAIRRYDGATGAYLGAFGEFFGSSPSSVVVRQSAGTAYILATSVFKYNYNTGEFLGTVPSSGLSGLVQGIDGTIYGFSSSQFFRLNTATNTFDFVAGAPAGTAVRWLNQLSNGQFVIGDSLGSRVMRANSLTSSFSSIFSGLPAGAIDLAGDSVSMVYRSSLGNQVGHVLVGENSATGRYFLFDNGFNPVAQGAWGSSSLTLVRGFAKLHYGLAIAGPTASGAGFIPVDETTNFGPLWGTNLIAPTCAASVLAPEPGTWAVLGLGLGAILRKRRRPAK